MKVTYFSSYMLKPLSFLAQGFKDNKEVKEKFFNPMCNFEAQAEWRRREIDFSFYIDVDTRKDQDNLLDP